MEGIFKIFLDSLPEALGGIVSFGIIALLTLFVKRRLKEQRKRKRYNNLNFKSLKKIARDKIDEILKERGGNFFQKYISKIYLERKAVHDKFYNFLNQVEKKCFIITGKAGKGKTNLFCNLAESLSSSVYIGKQICVLINGPQLKLTKEKTLKNYIASYFSSNGFIINFYKILKVLKDQSGEMLVFIDAINELEGKNAFNTFNEQMNELLESINEFHHPVKFCISCRTDFWNQFNTKDWVTNNVFEPMEKRADQPAYNSSFELDNFTEDEIEKVIEKYFLWYSLKGEIIGNAREICRDPIMLRYLCSAYTNRKIDDPPEKKIPAVDIGVIEILQRKKIFDKFVVNIRERMYNKLQKQLKLQNPAPDLLYEFTTRYLINIANEMLSSKKASITSAQVYEIAKRIAHPDSKLDKNTFFKDTRSIFFMFIDEGIILSKKGSKEYDFVFETYFEYSLGRYLALEKWPNLSQNLKKDSLPIAQRIDSELIKEDFKKLLKLHNDLLKETNFTNLLDSLHFAVLVTEDEELYKEHPFLFVELLQIMINSENFIFRQKALETIRESKLAAGIEKREGDYSLYKQKLGKIFNILYKLSEEVDFVIMWDLENTIKKLAQVDSDIVINEMKDWAEKGKKMQPMFATQALIQLCEINSDKVIDIILSLSNRPHYRINFWLARSLIFASVEICKNACQYHLSFENFKRLREMIESFLIEKDNNIPDVIRGLALSCLPYLCENNERLLEKITEFVSNNRNLTWGIWNLAYELHDWHNYGSCDSGSWIWRILNQIVDIKNPHINYAVFKTALALKPLNPDKANEIIRDKLLNEEWKSPILKKLDWRPDKFNGSFDHNKKNLTGIIYSPIYLEPSFNNHVECRERLQIILDKFLSIGDNYYNWVEPVKDETYLEDVHNGNNDRHRDGSSWNNYLIDVKQASKLLEEKSLKKEKIDTASIGPSELRYESYEVAIVSVGGVISAVNYVMKTDAISAWSLGRPPGHLANNKICIFNNIAVGAYYAIKTYNKKRILIIDCDAHHGKHTAWVFRKNPNVVYFSMHIEGDYAKEEGKVEHTGIEEGEGYNFNIPYPINMGDRGYRYIIANLLYPLAIEFKPELIMISAGFDGHFEDYLTPGCILSEYSYIYLAKAIRRIIKKINNNVKVVGALEGGYGLNGMANSLLHMISIISDWQLSAEKIGFVKKPDYIKEDKEAICKVKKQVEERINLMRKKKEKNNDYVFFSNNKLWRKFNK